MTVPLPESAGESKSEPHENLPESALRGPLLTSPQNPWVKNLVALRKDGNFRRECGRLLIEGHHAVAAALALPEGRVVEIIVCERLLGEGTGLVARAEAAKVPIVYVSKDVFRKIADVEAPQGIGAVVRLPEWHFEDLLEQDGLVVVACGLQDPGNVGTLIRSCEAAGAKGIVALEGTADFYNAKVVRSTAAALLTLPMVRMNAASFLARAREANLRLVGAEASRGASCWDFDWKSRPLAICVGSEGGGLPEQVAARCSAFVSIPFRGKSESLNAAVAASILLFVAQRSA